MNDELRTKVTTPFDLLDEHSGIDAETRRRAESFLNAWDGWQYGASPTVAAAMTVYYANMSKDGWTQEKVAELFDVTEDAMRSQWRKAENELATETLCELELGQYS